MSNNQNAGTDPGKKLVQISEKRLNALIHLNEKACRIAENFFSGNDLEDWIELINNRGTKEMEEICSEQSGYELETIRNLAELSHSSTSVLVETIVALHEISKMEAACIS